MNFYKCLVVALFASVSGFAQEKFTEHTIEKGDNIYQIAKKYNVKPQAVLDANPEAKGVLKLNSVLRIPGVHSQSGQNSQTGTTVMHKVSQKETLYGISKQYNVSVADIEKANPNLTSEGLKAEQQIVIPVKNVSSDSNTVVATSEVVKTEEVPKTELTKNTYKKAVAQKETKFSIAKEYGITVSELEKQNPSIKRALRVGKVLTITTDKVVESAVEGEKTETIALSKNAATDEVIAKDSMKVVSTSIYDEDFVENLISHASGNIGVRYRTGGTSRDGFDCSGLMVSTFNNFDIHLPRTSFEQSQVGTKVNFEEAQKGDLIFFKTNGRRQINHVGMVVEACEGEIKFIHAAVHGGVMISSTKETYYDKKLAQINRVLKRS